MGALKRLAGRVRAKPWLALGLAAGLLLVAAWLGWAIYVAADRGVRQGVGVLISWPALVVAAVLLSLPLAGIYLLIRRLSGESASSDQPGSTADVEPADPEQARATETG